MKILNLEQTTYLKSIDSIKKRRKFMLDCLVKNVLGESVKSEDLVFKREGVLGDHKKELEKFMKQFNDSTTTAPRTFEGILNNERFQLPSDVIQRSVDLGLKGLKVINEAYETADKLKNDESAKKETQHLESGDFDFNFSLVNAMDCYKKSTMPNYTPGEVDMAKNLMTVREKFAENIKKIDEKKWTDEDMIRAFEKGNHATCNAFSALKVSDDNISMYQKIKDEFIKSLKNE